MSWDSDIDSLSDAFTYADYRPIPDQLSEYEQADDDIREQDHILKSETIAIENEILTGSFSSLTIKTTPKQNTTNSIKETIDSYLRQSPAQIPPTVPATYNTSSFTRSPKRKRQTPSCQSSTSLQKPRNSQKNTYLQRINSFHLRKLRTKSHLSE